MSDTSVTTPDAERPDIPAGPGPSLPSARRPGPRHGIWLLVLGIVIGAVVFAGGRWVVTVEPLRSGSGGYSVTSPTQEVVQLSPPFGQIIGVVPFTEGTVASLEFPLTHDLPVPVRVVEVFPPGQALTCGWRPERVSMRFDSRGEYQPFAPVTLRPGRTLDLVVTGPIGCADGTPSRGQGVTTHQLVPVRWRLAGVVPRSSDVDAGIMLGWSPDPAAYVESTHRLVPALPAPDRQP